MEEKKADNDVITLNYGGKKSSYVAESNWNVPKRSVPQKKINP